MNAVDGNNTSLNILVANFEYVTNRVKCIRENKKGRIEISTPGVKIELEDNALPGRTRLMKALMIKNDKDFPHLRTAPALIPTSKTSAKILKMKWRKKMLRIASLLLGIGTMVITGSFLPTPYLYPFLPLIWIISLLLNTGLEAVINPVINYTMPYTTYEMEVVSNSLFPIIPVLTNIYIRKNAFVLRAHDLTVIDYIIYEGRKKLISIESFYIEIVPVITDEEDAKYMAYLHIDDSYHRIPINIAPYMSDDIELTQQSLYEAANRCKQDIVSLAQSVLRGHGAIENSGTTVAGEEDSAQSMFV
jgi:hypothetical protein